MAKHPNRKAKAAKADPMTGAMKFFLAGGVAELYLQTCAKRKTVPDGTT